MMTMRRRSSSSQKLNPFVQFNVEAGKICSECELPLTTTTIVMMRRRRRRRRKKKKKCHHRFQWLVEVESSFVHLQVTAANNFAELRETIAMTMMTTAKSLFYDLRHPVVESSCDLQVVESSCDLQVVESN
jgi:hypothetical protein